MGKYINLGIIVLILMIIWTPTIVAVNAIKLQGTAHDLSNQGDMLGMCQSCHVSNNASQNNSLLSAEVNQAGFSQLKSIVGLSSSLFCAQCHDGTISHRNISNATATSIGYENKGARFGIDNHPVNIEYPSGKEGFKINPDLKLYGPNHNQVKCNTCHNPHQVGTKGFLREKKICKACHDK
ncbi:MAG: hypothetical protein AWU54_771 [Candidatus Frackibacter sp. T328-2]|nr:MAG: hypothetical protein AWU54_771 [Candidatus Frackibacter sp. T328-2]